MPSYYAFLFWLLAQFSVYAQEQIVSGKVLDGQSKKPLISVLVSIEGFTTSELTDANGLFKLNISIEGDQIISLTLKDYITKRLPVVIENQILDLGEIFLDWDISSEQKDNLITLTDSELLDDEVSSNSAGLLQATKDVFLNRAAFDFGQAF